MAPRRTSSRYRLYLGSVFGRRLLGLFVLCALGPVFALSLVSGWRVTAELEDQGEERLHGAARTAGMLILERFALLDTQLHDAERVPPQDDPLRERVTALGSWRHGACKVDWGEGDCPPAPDEETLARLGNGEPALIVGPSQIELWTTNAAGRTRWARVAVSWLFDITHENALPPHAELCIFDADHRPLHCSLPGAAIATVGRDRGLFEWSREDVDYLAYRWPLFLRGSYAAPDWTIALAEPTRVVFAPIRAFNRDLAAVTVLAVFLAALFSAAQLRRNLVPLERLRAGTERIASGDFSQPVNVRPGDELAQLAHAFNAMSGEISDHFDGSRTILTLDREIVAAIDEEAVADVLVSGVHRIVLCDGVRLVLFSDGPSEQRSWSEEEGVGPRALVDPPTAAQRAWLEAIEAPQLATGEDAGAEALGLDPGRDHVLPVRTADGVMGFLTFSADPSDAPGESRTLLLRQLVEHGAAAIVAARVRAENRYLMQFDPSTGLPNRELFTDRIDQAIAQRARATVSVATIFLGGLARIQHNLGEEVADEVLATAVSRLHACAEPGSIARLGRAEFGHYDENARSPEATARRLEAMIEALCEPVETAEGELLLDPRVGVALSPQNGLRAEALIRGASTALRDAGAATRLRFFSSELGEAARETLRLEGELRQAIDQGDLRVYYQPIRSADDGELVGAEALVRWQHPERGVVSPAQFIGVAESSRLVIPLTRWVLEQVCADGVRWADAGRPLVRVNVNLSAVHVHEPDMVSDLVRILERSGLDPARLGVELTESLLLENDREIRERLEAIRRLGVRIALDDFGTGYSSFGYLREFPIDTVKIDRQFLSGVPTDTGDCAIVKSIISMAQGLGMGLVAEGVENEAQLAFLRDQGCERIQGYLFDPPLPVDEFEKRLEESDAA